MVTRMRECGQGGPGAPRAAKFGRSCESTVFLFLRRFCRARSARPTTVKYVAGVGSYRWARAWLSRVEYFARWIVIYHMNTSPSPIAATYVSGYAKGRHA